MGDEKGYKSREMSHLLYVCKLALCLLLQLY